MMILIVKEFIVMNMDKFIQRIRVIMKEQFVFKRDDLIRRIKANKDYPLQQIYTALSKLINDQNEYITDMFGASWTFSKPRSVLYVSTVRTRQYTNSTISKKSYNPL